MSLSPYQPPSRSKTRTRTAAQLDRKRARDRESQRLCRERNKERMAKIEAELSTLRARYESLLIVTERLGHIPSPVDSCNAQSISPPAEPAPSIIRSTNSTNSPSPPAWTAAAVPQEIASDSSPQNSSAVTLTAVADDGTVLPNPVDRYVSDGFLTSRLSNECSESNSGDMAYELLSGAGLYQSCPNSHKTLHAPTSTLGTGTSDQLPVSAVDEPLPWPGCLCGTVHRTPTDCLEYNVFHTILNAHIAIAVDTRAARRYPRSPSLANLLLIDVDINPIVRAIGHMMKCISPMQLADTTAVYFIMYRLLRWRVFPIPETYYDIPEWYRPSRLQRTRPHPICIDLIAWPDLRDYLIPAFEDLDKTTLGRDIAESITVEWPEDQQLLVKDVRTNTTILNPKFEEHIWKFSNWKMRRCWALRQPRFVHLVSLSEKE